MEKGVNKKKEDSEKPTELVSENFISEDLMKTEVPLESDSQVMDQESTDKKTSLNDALRTHSLAV